MNEVLIRPAVACEQQELEALQRRASLSNAGDRDALLAHPDAIQLPVAQIEAGGVFVAERTSRRVGSPERANALTAAPHGASLLCAFPEEWNGTIAGFSAVLPRADGETELDGLFVEPAARRLGIGRLLVEHCANVARAQGSSALHVVGNPHAEAFYLACGFETTGTTETRFGAGLLMRKILRA